MQQGGHAVFLGDLAQQVHHDMVLVDRFVGIGIDARDFELSRRDFVMFDFGKDAQFPAFQVEFVHERLDMVGDRSEVMIFEFLAFGRFGADQRTAGQYQVRTMPVIFQIDQEILLLQSALHRDAFDILFAQRIGDAGRFDAQNIKRAEQGSFLIQRFAVIGDEDGRDAKDGPADERRGRDIPVGIAAGFEGGA